MRALFGVVSLLVVLAIVGLVASRSMRSAVPTVVTVDGASVGGPAASGTVRDASRQIERKVKDDVARALEQSTGRTDAADK